MTEPASNLKQDAEWLRMCMEWGLRSKGDVIEWADREIASAVQPDPSVIDIALATQASPQDVLGLLRTVPGQADSAAVRSRFFRELADLLRAGVNNGARVAKILRGMAINGDAPNPRAAGQMRCFDDDFELIQYAGRDPDEVRRRMLEFLDTNS